MERNKVFNLFDFSINQSYFSIRMQKISYCFRVNQNNLRVILPQRVFTLPKNIFTKSITQNTLQLLKFRKQQFTSIYLKNSLSNQKLLLQTNHRNFSFQKQKFDQTMSKSNRILLPTGIIILIDL